VEGNRTFGDAPPGEYSAQLSQFRPLQFIKQIDF
jgi:hypothetical protein